MGKQPIYRLTSANMPVPDHSVDPSAQKFEQKLAAFVRIPDVLPVGSIVHIELDFVNEDGTLPHPMLKGGGIFRVCQAGGALEAVSPSGSPNKNPIRGHRDKLRELVTQFCDKLVGHSSGGAVCNGDVWDLGFHYVLPDREGDPRSLELRGIRGGKIHAFVVENYKNRPKDEGWTTTDFGEEDFDPEQLDQGILPENVIKAIGHFTKPPTLGPGE